MFGGQGLASPGVCCMTSAANMEFAELLSMQSKFIKFTFSACKRWAVYVQGGRVHGATRGAGVIKAQAHVAFAAPAS